MSLLLEIIEKKHLIEDNGEIRVLGTLDNSTVPSGELPVDVKKSDWQTLSDPERLAKTFPFNDVRKLKYFLNETLDYQEETQHFIDILIKGNDITITTYTHDVNGITERDQQIAEFCDEVYEDLRFILKRYE